MLQKSLSKHIKEGIDEIIMQLYCGRNRRTYVEGVEYHAAPFRNVKAANYLEGTPKFGGLIGTPKSTVVGRKALVVESDSDEDNSDTDTKA